MPRKKPTGSSGNRYAEDASMKELDQIRAPLYRELEKLSKDSGYQRGKESHLCCTRKYNQMRISPVEARSIARAFRKDPRLRGRLPAVLERLEKALEGLSDNGERQSFDCPLLENSKCMVHGVAKPIGCLAWHPRQYSDPEGEYGFTPRGWTAFAARDRLNDKYQGGDWKLRVIPLWLKRVFSRELKHRPKSADSANQGGGTGPGGMRRRRR